MTPHLPYSDCLDISALSRLFQHTTNSYKYLFFQSLLYLLNERGFEVEEGILLRDIEVEMLVTAWYPIVFFKLSFGALDQINTTLNRIKSGYSDWEIIGANGRCSLRREIQEYENIMRFGLLRFVPFRVLRPFFSQEVQGLKDHQVNAALAELSSALFVQRCPLYRFDGDGERIFIHPDWLVYFKQHYMILLGWASWHWADYMQDKNPGVPGIPRKLFPPEKRNSLIAQRNFWNIVLSKTDVRCLYSGKKIEGTQYHLDHFLPWRFVVHNQLWNLVPVSAETNSAKRDCLPDEIYLDRLAETQCKALLIARDQLNPRDWNRAIEPYLSDLRLGSVDTLLDAGVLCEAYQKNLKPLMSIAKLQGFQSGWMYDKDRKG